jgi:small subunit ribosomal protein S1
MAPDDEDFAKLLAEYEEKQPSRKRKDPHVGELVRGRVVTIGHDAVFLDLGAKSEGMIDLAELRDEHGKLLCAVGDTVEARVVETSGKAGCIVLRRTGLGKGAEAKAELEQAAQHGIPVEGVVSAVNKGGVEVQVAGVRAFCPISQLDLRHVEDASAYVGQRFMFRITRYEPGPKGRDANVVLSRRSLLEEESRARAAETRAQLSVGAVLRGKVTSIKDYGAFVDLGGVEGMLHVSELGHIRVSHPKDVLTVGQELEVQILKLEKSDDPKRPEKISLSLKSMAADPWADVAGRFPAGTKARGTIVRVEPFGAFVELEPGVEGLVHVSELVAGRRVNHAREVVKIGQAVEVTVLAADAERRRLSLSLAAAVRAAEAAEEAENRAAAPAAPRTLGTLGDLLNKKKR